MSYLVGEERLIRKLRKLSGPNQTEIVATAVYNASKNIVQADAKLRAPVNEGELRNGIKARKLNVSGNPKSEVASTSAHGGFVELGTGPEGAQNHSGISPEVSVSYRSTPWYVHESDIDVGPYKFQKMGEFYKIYGQAAQPYLYPALKDNRQKVKKHISNYVRRKLIEEVGK